MAVVIMVNVKILTSTNTHTGLSLFFCFGSMGAYFLIYYLLNLVEDDMIGLFAKTFSHHSLYFAIIFVSMALILVDNGLHLAQKKISKFFEK
jgi:Phospholipid-translocating P-type ATPase C-terminal